MKIYTRLSSKEERKLTEEFGELEIVELSLQDIYPKSSKIVSFSFTYSCIFLYFPLFPFNQFFWTRPIRGVFTL